MPVRPFEGHVPQFGTGVFVDESAVIIGDVVLGDDVSLWPTAVIRGDVERVRVGFGTNIQDGAVLHVSHAGEHSPGHALVIGRHVTIGHRAVAHACTIGDSCLIGIGAIILDGAVLEDYTLIGAGALV